MLLVTGANGFIGSVMVRELNLHGYTDILVSDHVPIPERPLPLSRANFNEFILADELLDRLEKDRHPELKGVFHMGACSSTTETNAEFLKRNNTEYTQKLFTLCKNRQIPFIYASSGAVYGDGALGFDDQTPPSQLKALNLYGWSKLYFDQWVVQQNQTPPCWYGLRFFNVYGPNEYHKGDMSSVIYKAFLQIKETGRLKLFKSHNPDYKDGEQMRDFVYVKDICRWMRELYEHPNIESGIYNMGYGQARTWLDLAQAVFKNMNLPVNIEWIDVPESIRQQYQYFTEAKIDHLKKQGLSSPQWGLEQGIQDYIINYLQQDFRTF